MKIKKIICVIIALVLVILCGCSVNKTAHKSEKIVVYHQAEKKEQKSVEVIEEYEEKSEQTSNSLPKSQEPEAEKEVTPQFICTLSVRCDEVFENLDKLDKDKYNLIAKDGIIYSSQTVEFVDGETVFDLLKREMRKNNIHMEFEFTPAFNSAYVEGIGNLYEFDCGETSGWVYYVNGKPAKSGCSECVLKSGDNIEWVYTCGF